MINSEENKIFDFDNEETSYFTHSLHPYPAKFPPQLPKNILMRYSKKGELVLDPFCGSGTVLVEARIQGINAIGVDVNGLACLLSKVKATPLDCKQINTIYSFLDLAKNELFNREFGKKKETKVKKIEGLEHWFQANVAEEISYILNTINDIDNNDVKDFLKIVLSSIIVRVSNQESDTRFAAINKEIKNSFTIDLFINRVNEYTKKIIEYSKQVNNKSEIKIYNADSRNLNFIKPNSIDIIITSPPYANSYDYYLYHKFRKRWLDIDVSFAQLNEIGSRREYSSLKQNPQKWIDDLKKCFSEINLVLKKQGLAFIVIGDSVIQKKLIKIDEVIKSFIIDLGFNIDDIVSSDLSGHSKIFNPAFAQKGKKEHLIILEKKNGRV